MNIFELFTFEKETEVSIITLANGQTVLKTKALKNYKDIRLLSKEYQKTGQELISSVINYSAFVIIPKAENMYKVLLQSLKEANIEGYRLLPYMKEPGKYVLINMYQTTAKYTFPEYFWTKYNPENIEKQGEEIVIHINTKQNHIIHLNEDTKPIEVETPKTFQRISIDKCIDFFESKNVEIYYFLFALKEIIKDWKFPQEKEK